MSTLKVIDYNVQLPRAILEMQRLLSVIVLATVVCNCCNSAPAAPKEVPKRPQLFDDEMLLSSDFVTTQPEVNATGISLLKGWIYNETVSREKRTLKRGRCNICGGGHRGGHRGGGFVIPVVIYKKYRPIQSGCQGCYSGCGGGCGGGGGGWGGGGFSYSSSQSSSYSGSWGRK